jgi:hypothetical protein
VSTCFNIRDLYGVAVLIQQILTWTRPTSVVFTDAYYVDVQQNKHAGRVFLVELVCAIRRKWLSEAMRVYHLSSRKYV